MRTQIIAAVLLWPALAWGQPLPEEENACIDVGGRGEACDSDLDCEFNDYATRCVQVEAGVGSCQVPCSDAQDQAQAARCALGETCVSAAGDGEAYCKTSAFRVDLNLLDQCIAHFLEGSAPVLGSDNVCSLERNLNRLLDQDGNFEFDIFDVDLCVRAFLQQPGCDPQTGICDSDDLVACEADEDCGFGLFCDETRAACARECGLIPSREPSFGPLERECAGRLKQCDLSRGRCGPVSIEATTCEVDLDCPAGAYCFLGRCAPTCQRALDCPDSGWFCTPNNRCRALPAPDADDAFAFDPRSYSVIFSSDFTTVDGIDNERFMPIAILDLRTRREVRDNSSVSFGYRLEVEYDLKQSPECLRDLNQLDDAGREECLITPEDGEAWLTPMQPFGTVFATGNPGIFVRLNDVAADTLSPGLYTAQVRAIFDNGSSSTFTVSYEKKTLSGSYRGELDVVLGENGQRLNGGRPLTVSLRLALQGENTRWNDLLRAEGLQGLDGDGEEDFVDLTEGELVHAYLNGNGALPFAVPDARGRAQNLIALKGIYSPRLGRLRLIGLMDIDAAHCASPDGACDADSRLSMRNPFGRQLRRLIQFIGPFDDRTRVFQGVYREKIDGLIPGSELTLDGSFVLEQSIATDEALTLDPPLRDAAQPSTVAFPAPASVLAQIQSDIDAHCDAELAAHFESPGRFQAYLRNPDAFPVLPDLVELRGVIAESLAAMQESDAEALTIYDYLRGRIALCEDPSAEPLDGPTAPGCINEAALRCGLALHQKALLSKDGELAWLDLPGLRNGPEAEHELFCSRTLPVEGCMLPPSDFPRVVTLQEHNRFQQALSEVLKLEAGRELSDAFMVLFRAAQNPFLQTSAISFKEERLLASLADYAALTEQLVGVPSSALLFEWPMIAFKTRGDAWLSQIHTIFEDRMDVVQELVDVQRRIFQNANEADFIFVQQLLQYEYLLQVWAMALQQRWQGEGFVYNGRAERVFEVGRGVRLQLTEAKNPLGVTPDQVFFESSDPREINWHRYRSRVEEALVDANAEVQLAVHELRASLADQDALEARLRDAQGAFESELVALCGAGEVDPCAAQRDRLRGNVTDSQGCRADSGPLGCVANFACDIPGVDGICDTVIEVIEDVIAGEPLCRIDEVAPVIEVGQGSHLCNGGEMAALLTERDVIEVARGQVVQRALEIFERFAAKALHFAAVTGIEAAAIAAQAATQVLRSALRSGQTAANLVIDGTFDYSDLGCIIAAGFTFGDQCITTLIEVGLQGTLTLARGAVDLLIDATDDALALVEFLAGSAAGVAIGGLDFGLEVQGMVLEIRGLLREYQTLNQQLAGLRLQIAETHNAAQRAADGFAGEVGFIADHLIGRETGRVLVGDHLVARSSSAFRSLLQLTYRMTVAFTHRYNLETAVRDNLLAQVYGLQTLDEVEDFVVELSRFEAEYCGREGIDCDAFNNVETFRFSVREELFPSLRDIVDARTGQVVTAGQQFHNIITSAPYLRRRVRGTATVDQIEIPFGIWLDQLDVAGGAGRRWMVNPLECNHIIDAQGGDSGGDGTVALNVEGENLEAAGRGVRYELWRGAVDFQRDCHVESVVREIGTDPILEYPIRSHVVGYAPQHALAGEDTPPSFATRSSGLAACVNADDRGGELHAPCWRYFARDRSLASPDWKLVMPLQVAGGEAENTWLLGDGLRESDKPIIEDLVLYIRHRRRPIDEL